MIASVAQFAAYFEGVRKRTLVAVDRVGPMLAGFSPKPGEWTCAQIVRHLSGAERFFVTKVVDDRFTTDLEPGTEQSWALIRAALDEVHRTEMRRLAAVPDSRLGEKVADLDGGRVSGWRFLMAMVEHEVHHRSQLDAWIALAGGEAPQIYGYRMEDVIAKVGATA
jgi:uncharacterized damage-inducible protein DinB